MQPQYLKKYINMTRKHEYDAIIIGAGIGGLVCGCYLAKAGMKTLIVEKNLRPGGYCTSFKRKNFSFDSCIHSFGSCAPGETMDQIINDLDLDVQINRADPSDLIVTPDHKIEIRNDIEATKSQFKDNFPKEKNINKFFSLFSVNSGMSLYYSLKKKTFKNLLDEYFSDYRIKAVIGILLANCGISPSRASAFSTILFFRSFIFHGGYYPVGGMQKFTDSLMESFLENGGKALMKNEVEKIEITDNIVKSVVLKNGESLHSDLVVSNIDLRYTLLKLIGKRDLRPQSLSELNKLLPSSSSFIVYLGLKRLDCELHNNALGIWKMPDDYNIENTFDLPLRNNISKNNFVFCSISPVSENSKTGNENRVVRLIVNAPFKEKEYWDENRDNYTEDLIDRAASLFPDLKSDIIYKEDATPHTLNAFTNNYRGAMCGWLNTESQNESDLLKDCSRSEERRVGKECRSRWSPYH